MDTETTDKHIKAASDNNEAPQPEGQTPAASNDAQQPSPVQQTNEPPSPEKPQEQMVRIVAIKFRDAGKLYDFDARNFELESESEVVVETDRGRALGVVVLAPRETPRAQAPDGLKNVLRLANDKDIESAERHAAREPDALRYCRRRVAERKMDMKLVKAEYLFDGSKIIFYFTADGRVDFRELVKDLAHHFHTRIEMRQIGVRDEAKLIGGLGVCGRELCCCSFLREFEPVSVKMAKEQGLALNPSKISGQCGRLLCCLGYEYETYCCLKKGLPKCGRKVKLGEETVEVTQIDVLRQQVTVRRPDNETEVVDADEIRRGKLEQPSQGGDQPQSDRSKGDKPKGDHKSERRRVGQKGRPRRQNEKKSEKPGNNEPSPAAPKVKEQSNDAKPPAEGEAKKRRRPRRRRRGRRGGGQDNNQGPTTPDKQ